MNMNCLIINNNDKLLSMHIYRVPTELYFHYCINIHIYIQNINMYICMYYKVSKIRLNGSHIISENGIHCSMSNISDVNSY